MSGNFTNPVNDIVSNISPVLHDAISTSINNNSQLYSMQETQNVIGWIKESKLNPENIGETASAISPIVQTLNPNEGAGVDSAFSEFTNKIVSHLMQNVPSFFGQLLLDNIRIQTQGIEKSVKFDLAFTLDPIKPYVEFVKKINGVEFLKLRALFQIDSDVKMSDLGFLSHETQRIIHLGNMFAHMKITLLQFSGFHNAVSVNEPKDLYEVDFEKDLSGINLSL